MTMELQSKRHDGQVNVLKNLQQSLGCGATRGAFGIARIQARQAFLALSQVLACAKLKPRQDPQSYREQAQQARGGA